MLRQMWRAGAHVVDAACALTEALEHICADRVDLQIDKEQNRVLPLPTLSLPMTGVMSRPSSIVQPAWSLPFLARASAAQLFLLSVATSATSLQTADSV